MTGQATGGGEGRLLGRHRRHQSPARDHVVKVLYAPAERAAVEQAAGLAGLRPSSYVAWAAVTMAEQVLCQPSGPVDGSDGASERVRSVSGDRELLAELIQARLALRRYGVLVNQAVAALHSGAPVPGWLELAVAGADRAVARVDAAAAAVARRLV